MADSREAEYEAILQGDEHALWSVLMREARSVVGRFPPPAGASAWHDDAVADVVVGAFDARPNFLRSAVAETVGAARFGAYIATVLLNYLRDQSRSTERGKLIQRLATIFGAEHDFDRVLTPYKAWQLDQFERTPWQGDEADLAHAAASARGLAVAREWNSAGPTPAPIKDAILRASRAMLARARGFVQDGVIAAVLQKTIAVIPDNQSELPHDPLDREFDSTVASHAAAADPTDGGAVAQAIWDRLDPDERSALPHLASESEVVRMLEVGRRQARAVIASTKAKIHSATLPGTERSVGLELLEVSRRTTSPDSPSESTESSAEEVTT